MQRLYEYIFQPSSYEIEQRIALLFLFKMFMDFSIPYFFPRINPKKALPFSEGGYPKGFYIAATFSIGICCYFYKLAWWIFTPFLFCVLGGLIQTIVYWLQNRLDESR